VDQGWRELIERHGETYLAGERVFQEGHNADALFIVVTGQVELLARGDGAAPRAVQKLCAGDLFGETSCFGAGIHDVTAVARSRTLLVRLHRACALELIQARPEFAVKVITALGSRIVDSTARIGEQRAAERLRLFRDRVALTPLQPGGRGRARVA
jgi:CRP-like cAMP-binding protein